MTSLSTQNIPNNLFEKLLTEATFYSSDSFKLKVGKSCIQVKTLQILEKCVLTTNSSYILALERGVITDNNCCLLQYNSQPKLLCQYTQFHFKTEFLLIFLMSGYHCHR